MFLVIKNGEKSRVLCAVLCPEICWSQLNDPSEAMGSRSCLGTTGGQEPSGKAAAVGRLKIQLPRGAGVHVKAWVLWRKRCVKLLHYESAVTIL